MDAASRQPQPYAQTPLARFLDCEHILSPRALAGDEPYVIFEDGRSDPFFRTLMRAFRGEGRYRGIVRAPAAAGAFEGLVFVEGPVWRRSFEALHAAGLGAPRARVLLYFQDDPSGFWDFAKACGDSLGEIVRAGGLPPEHAPAVAAFIEKWAGSRLSGGRLLPAAKYYTRDFRRRLEANGAAVTRVMAALADDASRAAYARVLFGTGEQVFSAFAGSVFGPQQYMDVTRMAPGDVLVNCGIGNGWELPYFLSRLRGEGALHNFDPNMCYDGTVYGEYIGMFADMITDHMMVLGDHDGELRLPITDSNMVRSDAAVRSDAEGAGFESYPCRTLDSLMAEGLAPRIDHIKMDVEGGEIFILKGAIGAIRAHRPKLSVAIYHEPEHFWDYPGYLIDALEDYRFYVRQYGYSRFETLLYAVPMEDDASGSGEERLLHGPVRAPDEAGGEPVLMYLRDRRGAERRLYAGPQRVLTRFLGAAWETGEMRPAPEIQNDDVVGVFEQPDRAVFVTKHAYGPGDVQLTIGESADGVDVVWTAAAGVSPEADCAIVESDDGGVRIVVLEAANNAAQLLRYADGALTPERDFELAVRPVAGRYDREGVLTLDVVAADGRGVARVRYAAAGRIAEEEAVDLGGRVAGVALIKSYGRDGPAYRPGFVVVADGAVRILERAAGGVALVRALPWDERFELVPVVVSADRR